MAVEQPNEEFINEGWYRYTDIVFEWWKVIDNLSDRSALKAFLHTDSLISDQCPWHPGTKGLEVFMAMISNGETRLCFSLKQISYARYWLHAYGLTSSLLPIPSTHYLLTLADLRSPPSPVTYKTIPELKNALKEVGKHNKRVKTFAGDYQLGSLRTEFERVRSVWGERRGVWMAIDFEGWEKEHTMITEFGWTIVRWEEEVVEVEVDGEKKEETRLKEIQEDGHWTVKEYTWYRNGVYVKDNRDHYDFGETEVMPKVEFKTRIGEMISKYAAEGPLFLVFHDRYGDVRYLHQLEVPGIDDLASIPNKPPGPGMYCVDTTDMFSALEGDSKQRRGLERACLLLKIHGFEHPHNAGNDAHFTMEVLRVMASGKPLDSQREERWPDQTEMLFGNQRSVKVEFTEKDLDSDDDDYY